MCDKVVEVMAEGWSKEAVAAELGISKKTLYNWMEEHPKFLHAIERGEQLQAKWWEEQGRAGMTGQIEGFQATPFVWMTKNILKWRDRQEISGDGGGALQINIVKHGKTKEGE